MTVAYAERMAAELPRSRITLIEGCGHHPANECPAKLAEKLGEVLAMDPPPPAEAPLEMSPETPAPADAAEVEGEAR